MKTESKSTAYRRSGAKPEVPKNLHTLDTHQRRAGHAATQRSISQGIEKYQAAKAGGLIDDTTPLTVEEERFVQGMNSGWTLAECFKFGWPIDSADLTPDQQHKRGFTISRRAHIIRRFLAIAPETTAEKKYTATRLRKLRRSVLEEIAQDTAQSTSQRLRAVDLLGKLPDVEFTDIDEAKSLTSQSSKEEIEKAVRAFMAKATKDS